MPKSYIDNISYSPNTFILHYMHSTTLSEILEWLEENTIKQYFRAVINGGTLYNVKHEDNTPIANKKFARQRIELHEYHGVKDTMLIFESKEDAVAFKLRFSELFFT